MEHVSMNDGLDGRETMALGAGAPEVATLVVALLAAYATVGSGLPGAVAWPLAGALALGGAILAWGRVAGRSLLEWAVLLVRFLARTRGAAALGEETGAVVMPLALRRHPGEPAPARGGRLASPPPAGVARSPRPIRVETFFSLGGGSGRTTLAVEVAALLAVRAAAGAAAGGPRARVALLDLAGRSPTVALRLGLPLLPAVAPGSGGVPGREGLAGHGTGLLVFTGVVAGAPSAAAAAARLGELLELAERSGARLAVVDIDNDLEAASVAVLRRSDRVHVTLSACAGGLLDAYRTTAALHRLGIRRGIDYVVNRCRGPFDASEAMGDLGGEVVAEIPFDTSLVDAEDRHTIAALGGGGPAAAALGRLADVVAGALPDEDGLAVPSRAV